MSEQSSEPDMSKSTYLDQHRRLHIVQLGAALALCLLAVSRPGIAEASVFHELIEYAGFCLVLAGVGGRLWSILYIGGRKNEQLVTIGPFSLTRNPLYFFSTVGATGAGLVFGSFIVAAALGAAVYLVFRAASHREASHLAAIFGAEYQAYAASTPMFWPHFTRYVDRPEWQFTPSALRRTFLDGLCFLAVFPGLELLEMLREVGALPVLLTLH
jgi:protein-S-isoprenylcysteine O-methyltransferase Ste14